MIDQLSYPREKFMTALYSLGGAGQLKDRIFSAWMSFLTLKSEDFRGHDELRAEFDEIDRRLTAKVPDPGDQGSVRVNLNNMSEEQAAELSEKITSLAIGILQTGS
jgi:hypothetical protein